MSVYNRKMFKRNARNALNQSAGIPSVQKFQVGGQVQTRQVPISVGAQNFLPQPVRSGGGIFANTQAVNAANAARSASPLLNKRMNVLQSPIAALRQTMNPRSATINLDPGSLSGIAGALRDRTPQDQSIRDFYGGGLKSVVTNPNPMTVGQQTRSDLAGAAASVPDFIIGGVATGMDKVGELLSPLVSDELTPGFVSDVIAGKQTLPKSVREQINAGEISVPANLSEALLSGKVDSTGIDLAKLPGFYKDQEVADVTEIMRAAPGSQTVAITGTRPAFPTLAQEEAAKAAGSRDDTTTTEDPAAAADRDEATVDQAVMKDGTKTPPDGTDASGDPSETGTTGVVPSTKEEIEKVINQGSEADQKAALDGFIKEFMDKAPGYEGADSGLILAKIGFAMAAGKSPRAIENIASALEGGADMLIKDKSKKDEFNRQLKLSALQYGLTETSKMRAEDRRISAELGKEGRALNYFVADGDVTVGDRTYKKGETVPVTTEYIRENGLPSNLTTVELAKAAISANGAYQKALAAAAEKKMIDPKAYGAITKDLNEATTDFVSAHQLRQVVQRNLITNAEGNITGVGPAFQQLVNRAFNSVGVDPGDDYENVDQFNQDMRRVSNSLLKDLLGEGSKNVSNIDRKLADEIVGLYAGYGGYIFQDPDLLNQRLQNVLATLERKERNALNVFQGAIDSTEGMTFRSGKAVSLNIPESARAALQGQGSTALSFQQGDDGVFRRV